MKTFVSLALLTSIVFTSIVPAFGQKSRISIKPIKSVGAVQFESIDALSEGQGVLVRWQTKAETNNVGFNVYRVTRRGETFVNSSMVLGSYARSGSRATAGEAYKLFDPDGKVGTAYVVRSFLTDGSQLESELTSARQVDSLEQTAGSSETSLRDAARSKSGKIEASRPELSADLVNEIQSTTVTPDPVNQKWVAAQPGVKIGVKKDGFYRVNRSQLDTAGFVAGNSANWRLFVNGVEQAMSVGTGDQYIEFYGKGIDTPETDTQIYYLISDTVPGKRISKKILRSFGGKAASNHYSLTTEKKERNSYVSQITNGSAENYWGRVILSSQLIDLIRVNITGIDFQTPTATVTFKIQGYSPSLHETHLVINGNELGSIQGGFQYSPYSGTFTVPTSYLVEGENLVDVYNTNSFDYDLFDSISVKYDRKFEADRNTILFSSVADKKIDLTGFSSENVRVFDLTTDGEPQEVVNLPVVSEGSAFTVQFPSSRPALYYAVEDSSVLFPASVNGNNPSTLSSAANGADLLIISHSAPQFLAASETWADYRRSQGFTVKVIDVADIFDEFGYGISSAESLKSFLSYAYSNWQTRPQYILLMGDGSRDPRGYEGFQPTNFIPSKTIIGVYEECPSDEALVDFDNDGIPEIAIGRIPARFAGDITTTFNRTVAFEKPAMQSLNRGVLFAYDVASDYNFLGYSQDLSSELSPPIRSTFVSRGVAGAQSTLINEINKAPYLVNYSGHGATGTWAASSFFGVNNVPQLGNSNASTVFTMLTCLNGYFVRPDADSLSESLLRSGTSGAVATWASTTETTPDYQMLMATRFFNRLNAGSIKRLGDLIKDAKTPIAGSDVAYSWVLLGDPMLQMRP